MTQVKENWVACAVQAVVAKASRAEMGSSDSMWFSPRIGLNISDSFAGRMLPSFSNTKKMEDRVIRPVYDLPYCDIKKSTTDIQIIQMLGGVKVVKERTVLPQQLRASVDRQWCGEPGPLHVDDSANVFFMLDNWGDIVTVRARWYKGWHLFDRNSSEDEKRSAGDRVFYNNG